MQGAISLIQRDFRAFREECLWCRIVFNTHEALFSGGDETDRLLRDSAGLFFMDYSVMSQEYHALLVGRLTDPPQSKGYRNLTSQYLLNALQDVGCCTKELTEVGEALQQYRGRILDSRNKLIAHRDLRTVRSRRKARSHPADELYAFHRNLQTFCDLVATAIDLDPLDFSSAGGKGDAIDLIKSLKAAQRERDE